MSYPGFPVDQRFLLPGMTPAAAIDLVVRVVSSFDNHRIHQTGPSGFVAYRHVPASVRNPREIPRARMDHGSYSDALVR